MIDLITIIGLALFGLGCYLRMLVLSDRCKNLEIDCDRKDAILADHLTARDQLLATMSEVEGYNAWLEYRNMQLERKQSVYKGHMPVLWGNN